MGGGRYPRYDIRGVLLPGHINNNLSVYLFQEFEPQLDKLEEFKN